MKVGGKVAGPLVAISEAYFNYHEEEAREKAERQLRTLRADLRASFADIARQFDTVLQEQSAALLTQLYDNPLEDASALSREIVAGGDHRTALAQQLSGLEHWMCPSSNLTSLRWSGRQATDLQRCSRRWRSVRTRAQQWLIPLAWRNWGCCTHRQNCNRRSTSPGY